MRFAILLFLSFFLPSSAFACQCIEPALSNQPIKHMDFFETVSDYNLKAHTNPHYEPMTVITGQVRAYENGEDERPRKLIVHVETVMQGNLSSREIIVYGDNGGQCRPDVKKFTIEGRYYFALRKDDEGFYIPGCGNYYKAISEPTPLPDAQDNKTARPKLSPIHMPTGE